MPGIAPVVSTSAQYGAMIGINPLFPVKPVGVKSLKACPNVTLPLLLTNNELKFVPKKFSVNGSEISLVDWSSFGGKTFAVNPGKCRIAPFPVRWLTKGPPVAFVAIVRSAVLGPSAVVEGLKVTPMVQFDPELRLFTH